MRYVGAIDQGTTSTRFIVFDRQGDIISVGQKEHRHMFPRPGWVEHDADEIWRNAQDVMGEALEGSIAVTGALVQWLRDNLGIISSSGEVEALAREVEDNATSISSPPSPASTRPTGRKAPAASLPA